MLHFITQEAEDKANEIALFSEEVEREFLVLAASLFCLPYSASLVKQSLSIFAAICSVLHAVEENLLLPWWRKRKKMRRSHFSPIYAKFFVPSTVDISKECEHTDLDSIFVAKWFDLILKDAHFDDGCVEQEFIIEKL